MHNLAHGHGGTHQKTNYKGWYWDRDSKIEFSENIVEEREPWVSNLDLFIGKILF